MKLSDFHRLNLRGSLLAAIVLAGCADASTFEKLTSDDLTCSGLDCRAGKAGCNNDGMCEGDETVANCPADCKGEMGPACGDGTCDAGETALSCPADCADGTTPASCGDGTCDADEDANNCAEDCSSCGDGTCGDDEDNASCAADCPSACGDGVCDADETRAGCPMDCCDVIEVDPAVTDVAYSHTADTDPDPDVDNGFELYQGNLGNVNGSAEEDWLAISFWESGRFELGGVSLSAGKNATWSTCEQCVQVYEDLKNDGTREKTYFQTGGLLEVGGSRPNSGAASMRLHGVVLREVDPDSGEPLADENAACYYIDGAELTMPVHECGDGSCSIGEMACPADCSCGNGSCDAGETPGNCAVDCGAAACGNDRCEVGLGENKMNCPQDCCELSATEGSFDDLAAAGSNPDQGFYFYQKTFDDISGGPRADRIEVQFYAGSNLPLVEGDVQAWDLGTGANMGYATCEQCVLVLEDWDDATHYGANYFQARGKVEVRAAPASGKTNLTFLDTVLVESVIDWDEQVCHPDKPAECQGGGGTYASMPVPDARCYYLDNVRFASP